MKGGREKVLQLVIGTMRGPLSDGTRGEGGLQKLIGKSKTGCGSIEGVWTLFCWDAAN